MFFKIGLLKNFAIFTGKHNAGRRRPPFAEHLRWLLLNFCGSKYFFQQNVVFIADSHTGFCSELLWKHELNVRRSHWNFSVKKGVFRNFTNFTGKHLCWSLFLIELQTFRPAALLKRDSKTGVLLWNLQNFNEHLIWSLRTPSSETCSFTWTSLFNNLHFWLKLIHML